MLHAFGKQSTGFILCTRHSIQQSSLCKGAPSHVVMKNEHIYTTHDILFYEYQHIRGKGKLNVKLSMKMIIFNKASMFCIFQVEIQKLW